MYSSFSLLGFISHVVILHLFVSVGDRAENMSQRLDSQAVCGVHVLISTMTTCLPLFCYTMVAAGNTRGLQSRCGVHGSEQQRENICTNSVKGVKNRLPAEKKLSQVKVTAPYTAIRIQFISSLHRWQSQNYFRIVLYNKTLVLGQSELPSVRASFHKLEEKLVVDPQKQQKDLI